MPIDYVGTGVAKMWGKAQRMQRYKRRVRILKCITAHHDMGNNKYIDIDAGIKYLKATNNACSV